MKLNIANPESGTQKTFELDDEKAIQRLVDKRVAQEFDGSLLGEKYEGYIFRITGGADKQGFPMKQGILANSRVKLLLTRGEVGYQAWRGRVGERNRKSVRGCIVGSDISVLNLIVVQKGKEDLEGLTDKQNPRRLGPKRANHIRRLFDLSKEDDVRKYVIRRETPKGHSKAPKIQRLVTPVTLQRRRRRRAQLKQRHAAAKDARTQYYTLVTKRRQVAQQRSKAAASRKKLAAEAKN